MPKHPRLFRRGATYYHRAVVPQDIKATYPKTEETFSLRTTDYKEALRRVRIAAVEVDRRFEAHRRMLAESGSKAPLKELADSDIDRVAAAYYAHLLEEDEEIRIQGFTDDDNDDDDGVEDQKLTAIVQTDDPEVINRLLAARLQERPSFTDHQAATSMVVDNTKHGYARGRVDAFIASEAEDVLNWDNINIRLEPSSPSWPRLARALQAATLKAYEAIRRRNEGEVIETPKAAGVPPESRTPLLSMAVEEWIAEKSRTSWVPKTEKEHRVWMDHFISLIGDRPLDSYTKADARAFKAVLLRLPPNWVKVAELQGLPIEKAADKAKKLGLAPMSDHNVNKLMRYVGSFWTWAQGHYDEATAHPFNGLQIKLKKNVRDERDPFTTDELRTIFNAPIYTGCKSAERWHKAGSVIPIESAYYWVPLISLYTGARLGEVLQLYLADIREEDDVLYFDINDAGDDKRLKTPSSRRIIPVHNDLIEFGLLEYVEKRRGQGHKRLFPDIEMGQDGYYSSPFSKRFSRFLKYTGIKHKTNAFHSFRHCFEDACRDSDISTEIMNALQGHSEKGMAARYGKGFALKKLAEAMGQLRFRGLDLSHLMRR